MLSKEVSFSIANYIAQYKWSYFLTVTCKRPRRDSIALMRDIWEELQSLSGVNWSISSDGLYSVSRAFLACEPHKFSSNLHAHGLVSTLNPAFILMQGNLNKRFGRSRVETIRNSGQVSAYCAKYASKWSDGDNYDFFGLW